MSSNLAFCYIAKFGYNPISLYFVIFIENFSGGIGDAVFVAFLSGLCNKKHSATQYAVLFSLASVARTFLSSPAGIFAQNYGWFNFFIISTLLAIPSLILLRLFSSKLTLGKVNTKIHL
jgi:MFS transporter, PAT family, beta-lactamase induction signal transducer AmpG